eukprot:TRINITY_DN5621_c0_g1_i1.p1 TRINITY_DN5621_c0_g1~~TRINITY_DN5621_c0_g1_i1.p1  ORF type:complete len:462 (-),score=56.98 TRINITY_DN5621_c0_g1_i1:63-1448(-)
MAGRKIFVGSLPHAIRDEALRLEFERYGVVEDVYVKANCEVGRQWAMVTFSTQEAARAAKDACDRLLTFPGADRPCDVMLAKNQGSMGVSMANASSPTQHTEASGAASVGGPRKVFVGSLPGTTSEAELRAQFGQYGVIEELFLKANCEPGRQWAFITYQTSEQAQFAKASTDRVLMFPGSERPCEVTLARNQQKATEGLAPSVASPPLVSQSYATPQVPSVSHYGYQASPAPVQQPSHGPRKVFIGSLPDGTNEIILRAAFSHYGQILDCHVPSGCEMGRQWALLSFASPEQAVAAKEGADRTLMLPGADRPCEVMIAKNQGRPENTAGSSQPSVAAPAFAAPIATAPRVSAPAQFAASPYGIPSAMHMNPFAAAPMALMASPMLEASIAGVPMQPPPPSTPAPMHLTPWREYKTAAGLPYYHNHATGVTQWECPPDLAPSALASATQAQVSAGVRYAPY